METRFILFHTFDLEISGIQKICHRALRNFTKVFRKGPPYVLQWWRIKEKLLKLMKTLIAMLRRKANCPHFQGAQDLSFPTTWLLSTKKISTLVIYIMLDTSMALNSHNTELASMYPRMPLAGATTFLNIRTYKCQQLNVWFSECHNDCFRTLLLPLQTARQAHMDWLWHTILTVALMESLKLVQRKTASMSP